MTDAPEPTTDEVEPKTNLTIHGLTSTTHADDIAHGAAMLLRLAGVDVSEERVSIDVSIGTLTIREPDLSNRHDEIGTTRTEHMQMHGGQRAGEFVPALARQLAREALRLLCTRHLREMAKQPGRLPPAWATTVDFDLALAAKLEGKDIVDLHAALASKVGMKPDKAPRDRNKWHVGRRVAQGVERYGVDADLPDWPGMSGEIEWSHHSRTVNVRMHMLDFENGAYLSARTSYSKISLPRELSDEEVLRIGDGSGLGSQITHPFIASRRILVSGSERSKTKTTLLLRTGNGATALLLREGNTGANVRVRMAEPPQWMVDQAAGIAKGIMHAGGIASETIPMKPFLDAMAFADVVPDRIPHVVLQRQGVGLTVLAKGIKASFLRHMAEGEPWDAMARDVAMLMREGGTFLAADLLDQETTTPDGGAA